MKNACSLFGPSNTYYDLCEIFFVFAVRFEIRFFPIAPPCARHCCTRAVFPQVSVANDRVRIGLGRQILAGARRPRGRRRSRVDFGPTQRPSARGRLLGRRRTSALPRPTAAAPSGKRRTVPAVQARTVPATEFHRTGAELHLAARRPQVRAQVAVRSVVRHQAVVVLSLPAAAAARLLSTRTAAAVLRAVSLQRRVGHVSI